MRNVCHFTKCFVFRQARRGTNGGGGTTVTGGKREGVAPSALTSLEKVSTDPLIYTPHPPPKKNPDPTDHTSVTLMDWRTPRPKNVRQEGGGLGLESRAPIGTDGGLNRGGGVGGGGFKRSLRDFLFFCPSLQINKPCHVSAAAANHVTRGSGEDEEAGEHYGALHSCLLTTQTMDTRGQQMPPSPPFLEHGSAAEQLGDAVFFLFVFFSQDAFTVDVLAKVACFLKERPFASL